MLCREMLGLRRRVFGTCEQMFGASPQRGASQQGPIVFIAGLASLGVRRACEKMLGALPQRCTTQHWQRVNRLQCGSLRGRRWAFQSPPPRHGLVETAPESNSACVDLRLECAGWAACVVGPGVAGQVFVIAQPSETMMQILPTEEQAAKVDFTNYSSPDADYPMMGVIAALTVKALGEAMFCNVMRKEHILGLAPLKPIDIPPLKTYSYIATTDEALCLL